MIKSLFFGPVPELLIVKHVLLSLRIMYNLSSWSIFSIITLVPTSIGWPVYHISIFIEIGQVSENRVGVFIVPTEEAPVTLFAAISTTPIWSDVAEGLVLSAKEVYCVLHCIVFMVSSVKWVQSAFVVVDHVLIVVGFRGQETSRWGWGESVCCVHIMSPWWSSNFRRRGLCSL